MTHTAPTQRRIVVGVDSSDNAARAADWAAQEAADRSLPLHLVHALDLPGPMGIVIEPPEYDAEETAANHHMLRRILGNLRERHPYVAITGEISELSPAETLVAFSRDAELVVTGTRGHGGFAGMLLGSVSHALAAHAHCPTIVVRGEQPDGALDEIVLGVEPDQAEAPIRFAFATAATVGASVTIVRAWWMQTAYEGRYTVAEFNAAQAAQEDDINKLIKAVREEYPHVEVSVNAIRGNPVPVLTNAAQGSRMLVVGAHRHRGPLSVGIGYVTAGLLSHSPTPVAVVPVS